VTLASRSALSTTSVAVVYAVMIETGFNKTEIGKIILAACFINDLGTVLALGIVFAHYDRTLLLFGAVAVAVLIILARYAPGCSGAWERASVSRRPSS
jgi:Kef-type K+ transport system membrane component KefB